MDGTEQLITMTEATKRLPGRPSIHCIWRWCRKGVRSRNGERIYLKHVRMGRQIYTRLEWIEAFGRGVAEGDAQHFKERQDAPMPPRVSPSNQRDALRRQQIEQANRELDAAGI